MAILQRSEYWWEFRVEAAFVWWVSVNPSKKECRKQLNEKSSEAGQLGSIWRDGMLCWSQLSCFRLVSSDAKVARNKLIGKVIFFIKYVSPRITGGVKLSKGSSTTRNHHLHGHKNHSCIYRGLQRWSRMVLLQQPENITFSITFIASFLFQLSKS